MESSDVMPSSRTEAHQKILVCPFAQQAVRSAGRMIMFTGPAGAGKSTLARAWCYTRPRAVHVELGEVSHLIVSGRADPQEPGALQAEQYDTSVAACCALVREFVGSGYDVAVDDAVDPRGFEAHWLPRLGASSTRW